MLLGLCIGTYFLILILGASRKTISLKWIDLETHYVNITFKPRIWYGLFDEYEVVVSKTPKIMPLLERQLWTTTCGPVLPVLELPLNEAKTKAWLKEISKKRNY